MSSSLVLTVTSSRSDLSDRLVHTEGRRTALNVADHFRRVAAGLESGSFDLYTSSASPVAASGTITLASVAADDTVTIGGVTFTAKASPSGSVQFSQAGTDTQDAASLAAKINAHSTLSQIVSATSASGVVTVTCRVKGVIGNFITLASTGGTMTLSASALAGGTGGVTGAPTSYTLS